MTGWVVPEELRQPVPRRVRVRGSILLTGLFLLLLVAASVLLIVRLCIETHDLQILKAQGQATDGTIIALNTRRVERRHQDPVTYFYVDYTYHAIRHDPDGYKDITFERKGDVSPLDYGKMAAGQTVPVVYDVTRPEKSALAVELPPDTAFADGSEVPVTGSGGGGFLVGITLVMLALWIQLGRYQKEKALVVSGRVAQPLIIDKSKLTGRSYGFKIVYKFEDSAGRTVEGVANSVPSKIALGPEEKLAVVYDPEDSSRNALYPLRTVVCLPSEDRGLGQA